MIIPKDGDTYKVKFTPVTRHHGVRCGTLDRRDDRVRPGEIGIVETFQANGWKGIRITFSRCRTVQIATLYEDSDDWVFRQDELENLVKVKVKNVPKE